ncbi:MAG: ectoine/hydroxyectoine ABC transporter substrate-binding protein EhuB [Kiritimatiellae bacterium]|nr:ectoine/hydroxyectoine ABC transporter substrate-binding protein EhuB [Kiritimatiellia bacterium]
MGLLALFAGCGPASDQSTLERIQERGVVRIGYANEAPYGYMDTETGELTGEAPEIAKVILQELGVTEVEAVLTEFGSLVPGLQAGRFDLVAAGMYITPERCQQIAFSNPTYVIGEAFAVRVGNPKSLHSYEDIRDHEDATLGVVSGAIERRYAREIGIPDDRVMTFPDAPAALAAVRAGRVDAYGGTSLTVQDLLSKDTSGELEQADPFTDPVIDGESVRGYGAFGFRQADTELVEAFNEKLADFIGSEAHLALVEPFGFTETNLPGDVTAADLCAGRTTD